MPSPPAVQPPSQAVQQSLIGGVVALIVEKLEAGEGERLEELLPDLVELFLSPFVGRAAALAAVARPEAALAYIWKRRARRRKLPANIACHRAATGCP